MFMRITDLKIWYTVFLLNGTIFLEGQLPVEKTNPMKVYMHYQPWYETPETIGRWGWHWIMNNRDPEKIGPDGKREIASHYYPLIGPYASRDRDVIEYHLLLMKYSGIDGILIDWYGTAGSNGDLNDLLTSSDTIVSCTDDFGVQFGVVLEDRFSRSGNDVKNNFAYLRNHYFILDEYIRTGEGGEPLVCIFGPVTFEDPAYWDQILPSAGEEIELLPLWYESGDVGDNADGEFSWVYQDNQDHMVHLENYYKFRAPNLKTAMGSAYPGFEDFYEEGEAGNSNFTIPHYSGSTLDATLGKAEQYKDRIDMLQLVTFNDFGEGTMFEPTLETGFDYLVRVQEYTGVEYGEAELKLVYRLYLLRKEFADEPVTQGQLDQVSVYLRNLDTEQAWMLLESIKPSAVFPPREEPYAEAGSGVFLFPNPVTEGGFCIRVDRDLGFTRLVITDISGKVVFRDKLSVGQELYSVDNLHLPPGIFLLSLSGECGISNLRFAVKDRQ